jgi:Flp pilus assembly protein TadB
VIAEATHTAEPWGALAAVLAAAAVVLVMPARPKALSRPGGGDDTAEPERDPAALLHLVVSSSAGLAPVIFLGGPAGVAAGLVVAVLVHRSLSRREPASERRRREAVSRSLPHVVDLLAVALAAGSAPSTAFGSVAAAVGGPVAEELDAVRRGLDLGRDPVQVFRDLAGRPGLASLGRTLSRAVETGASVSDALHRLADDVAATARQDAEARARTVGVRAAAPLGLCLLPAFVLVGVVPLVAGTVGSLLLR